MYFHTSMWGRPRHTAAVRLRSVNSHLRPNSLTRGLRCSGGSFLVLIVSINSSVHFSELSKKLGDDFYWGSLGCSGPEGEVVLFPISHTFNCSLVLFASESQSFSQLIWAIGNPGNWKYGLFLQVQIKGDGENAWRVSAKVANSMNCKVDWRRKFKDLRNHWVYI